MSEYDANEAFAKYADERRRDFRQLHRIVDLRPAEEFPPINAKWLVIFTAVVLLSALASAFWPMGVAT